MSVLNLSKIKDELRKEYKYKIEAHAHTAPISQCGEASVEEVINTYASLGYDAVVITNHFISNYHYMNGVSVEKGIQKYLSDYYEAVKIGEKKNMKVLLGAEIRFPGSGNDYLIYGVEESMLLEIYNLLPEGIENFRKNYSMPNSLFLQAHPFRDGMIEVDPSLLDGYEIFNMHPDHNGRLAVATMHAKVNNKEIVTVYRDNTFIIAESQSLQVGEIVIFVL